MLKPQDLMILTQLCLLDKGWTYAQLAKSLCMSASEVHAGVKRAVASRLYNPHEQSVNRRAFLELLQHGVPYVYPAKLGPRTRGLRTSYAAHPLSESIAQPDDLPPVWPWPTGPDAGFAFEPLFHSAPEASQKDSRLYECLTLIDALRGGQARERKLAITLLKERLLNEDPQENPA